MSVLDSVTRLQALIEDRYPRWAAGAGAVDADVQRLRDAVAPLIVPAEVEALYRWRDGLALPVLYGYGLQPIRALLAARTFEIDQLGFPPAWLVLSEPPGGGGCRLFATMTAMTDQPHGAIWSVGTHDAEVTLMYESLTAAIETFCDMVQDVASGVAIDQVGQTGTDDLPRGEDEYRIARSPGAFVFPNPPAGTTTIRFVDPGWPEAWLRSIGTTSDALRMQGGARPIADLATAADTADFPFRVMGEVGELSGTSEISDFRISDQTGSVWVHSVHRRTLLVPQMRRLFEVDLEQSDSQYNAVAIRQAD